LTIRIHVAGHLKDYTGRSVDLEIEGAEDILDVIAQLDERVPTIRDRIFDEHDRTRPFINIYVNEEDIRFLQSKKTALKDGDQVSIVPAIAGGR
jgi:molybdopterin synthase sulfur carrier subunit